MSYLQIILVYLFSTIIGFSIWYKIYTIKLDRLIKKEKEQAKITDKFAEAGGKAPHTFRNYKKKKGDIRILI